MVYGTKQARFPTTHLQDISLSINSAIGFLDCGAKRRQLNAAVGWRATGIVTLIVLGRKGPHGFPFQAAALAVSHTLNVSFRNRLNVSLLHK